jgi:predicted AAA+ superfamily ATPase
MKRHIIKHLEHWKHCSQRKPLILRGARQVGKSYSVKEFASKNFKQFIRIDFLLQKEVHLIFSPELSLDPKRILNDIGFLLNIEINRDSALLFFDEIQESPGALASLKYFQEQMPELALIAAGSYLGIMVNENSFPVGKVDFLSMYPMTFDEFLMAYNPNLYSQYNSIDILESSKIDPLYHQKLMEVWKRYLAIGGMPEVVSSYIENHSINELMAATAARKIQRQLLTGYKADFAKHSGTVNAGHILSVFDSVAIQLSKSYDEEVGKFLFIGVIPKQKGFDRIRGPLTWLAKSRLVIKNYIANKAEHPLKAYTEENRFKLFFLDVGLLNASLEIPVEAILGNQLGSYKGFIAENFVAQELVYKSETNLYSWAEGKAEVEFLWISGKDIVPIEVKSSAKSARAKSLDSFIAKYNPPLAYKVTAQNRGYDPKRKMMTIPIYLTGKIE